MGFKEFKAAKLNSLKDGEMKSVRLEMEKKFF
jgi:hypothetical protein